MGGQAEALDPLGPFGHVVPRPAATVVLIRPAPGGPEVLLTRRPETMAFAAGLHAFPGGAVDAGDSDAGLLARLDDPTAGPFHIAALRELFEEAGVLLADTPGASPQAIDDARARLLSGSRSFGELCDEFGITLFASALVPLARWVTPPIMPRRFDARFFAAALPAGVEPTFPGDEVAGHRWLTPRAALDGLADGSVPMWMPTSTTLQRLESLATLSQEAETLRPGPPEPPEVVEVAPDVIQVRQGGGAGVDGLVVNAYLVGGRELVAVDPGDPSEEALLAIAEAATAIGGTIGTVALTSADPDHAGGAEHLREGLSVVVHGGAGAGHDLPFDVTEIRDGQPVPAGDVRVVAVAAPGPRPDHTVYWIPASRTAIVGDLVGPPAERSLRRPPDREAWRDSLGRLAALGPERLLPAHGEVVEGPAAVASAISTAVSGPSEGPTAGYGGG